MFAALTVVRLREAVSAVGLDNTKSWVSPDEVPATELPLAKAAERVLASTHEVLQKTKMARDEELEGLGGALGPLEKEKDSEKRMHLRKTKAAEIRLVRHVDLLKNPKVKFEAEMLEV